tara:strand:- start:286 stop:531 length:246 start_codon:yes stop_codon:yes gene_type:complete
MVLTEAGHLGVGPDVGNAPSALIHAKETDGVTAIFKAETSSTVVFQIKGDGQLNVQGLPTSNQGLAAGDLYRSGNTLQVAT